MIPSGWVTLVSDYPHRIAKSQLFSAINLYYVIAAIMADIRIIRVLILLILNRIYNTNFTNVMNSTKLNITEITGILTVP